MSEKDRTTHLRLTVEATDTTSEKVYLLTLGPGSTIGRLLMTIGTVLNESWKGVDEVALVGSGRYYTHECLVAVRFGLVTKPVAVSVRCVHSDGVTCWYRAAEFKTVNLS